MKWFLNMKIGAKMITGFLVIALLSAAMGVFALINVRALQASDTQLHENMLIPTEQMASINQNFLRQRVQIRQALLSDDPQVIEEQLNKITAMRQEADELDAAFEAKILSDRMRQLFDAYKAAKSVYRPLVDQVIEHIKEGHKEEAIALIADDGDAGLAAAAEMEAIKNVMSQKVTDGEDKAAANTAQADSVTMITIIILVVVLVLSIVIGILISRIISKPIQETAACAKALASGDLDAVLNVKSQDEAGQLASTIDGEVRQAFKDIERARAVSEKQARYQSDEVNKLLVNLQRLSQGELFCDIEVNTADEDTQALHDLFSEIAGNLSGAVSAIKGYIKEISEVLGEMSDGNLSVEITSVYKGDFIELKRSINTIIGALNETLQDINNAAEQVAAGTGQVSEGSQTISQGATEQASSIEELSASATQIAEQTRQNAENANNANTLANNAKNDAVSGNEQMKAMQQAMVDINESSDNISKIIKVIDDIAFQTNILALNAAVEAARAGVHGKGFAVVAEEVRNLAAKSADAAKQTTDLIEGSIRKAEAGTKIADETAEALSNIVSGVEKAAQLVGEIATASNEQASAITQVNNGIEQMSQVVQTNSATSEEAAAAAEELSAQAERLKGMVGEFKLRTAEKDKEAPPAEENDPAEPGEAQVHLNDEDFGKY